jgi:dTDP-4-dehydrorhamnose 3,5-epimerase
MIKVMPSPLSGVIVVESQVFGDSRGFFMEIFNVRDFESAGLPTVYAQDNISRSRRGTMRGLHYQLNPHAQGKLVRALAGEVFDVAVDLRKDSPTFGKWHGEVLSAENKRAMYIPPGLAHGFLVLSETADFFYKCTTLYAPEADRGIAWNDPAIGIQWPLPPDPALLSDKDKKHPLLAAAETF